MDERLVVVEFLQGMPVGSEHYFNMCQGGGAMVERVDAETYDLYEIPLFGGREQYYGRFAYRDLGSLVDTGFDVFV